MKKEALALGKLLVNELGLQSSVDTLSRWMAHYIAQQMALVENADGDCKQDAEDKCFQTILMLWKHRAYYEHKLPFENFIPIFKMMERLNPDNEKPYYFQPNNTIKDESVTCTQDTVNQYLKLATGIDEVVRIWLKFVFQQASMHALDDKTKEWIEAAASFADNDEIELISRLLSDYRSDNHNTAKEEDKKKLIERRIEQLKSFREFNEELISMYKVELDSI